MKTLWIILFVVIVIFLIWDILTKKYDTKYKQYLYLGIKRTGKTTTMTKWIYYYLKRGYTVYTDATDIRIPGLRIIDINDLGRTYAPYSIFFIDELSRYWDNRNYQNKEYRDKTEKFLFWLRAVGHDHCIVYMFSQSYDVDIKIRSQCDKIVILQKWFRVLTVGRRLRKDIAIKDTALQADSQITQHLEYEPFFIKGSWEFTFIPRWRKKFNSFSNLIPDREPLHYQLVNELGDIDYQVLSDDGKNKQF